MLFLARPARLSRRGLGRLFIACSSVLILTVGSSGMADTRLLGSLEDSRLRGYTTPTRTTTTLSSERQTETEPTRRLETDTRRTSSDIDRELAKTLSWNAPMQRENGNSLYPGEIDGYRIYFKRAGQDYYKTLPINDGSATSLSLGDFAPGTYEFSISTLDTEGLESRRSSVVRVKII